MVDTEPCDRFTYYSLRPEVLDALAGSFSDLAATARATVARPRPEEALPVTTTRTRHPAGRPRSWSSSPTPVRFPPSSATPAAGAEHGRGLLVVEALSARWGWTPHDPGKAVFAIFTREG